MDTCILIYGNFFRYSEKSILSLINFVKQVNCKVFIGMDEDYSNYMNYYNEIKDKIIFKKFLDNEINETRLNFTNRLKKNINLHKSFIQFIKLNEMKNEVLKFEKNNNIQFKFFIKLRTETTITVKDFNFFDNISEDKLYGNSDFFLIGKRKNFFKYMNIINSDIIIDSLNNEKIYFNIDCYLKCNNPYLEYCPIPLINDNEDISFENIKDNKYLYQKKIYNNNYYIIRTKRKYTGLSTYTELLFVYYSVNNNILLEANIDGVSISWNTQDTFTYLNCYFEGNFKEDLYNYNFFKNIFFKEYKIQLKENKLIIRIPKTNDKLVIDNFLKFIEDKHKIKIINYAM